MKGFYKDIIYFLKLVCKGSFKLFLILTMPLWLIPYVLLAEYGGDEW